MAASAVLLALTMAPPCPAARALHLPPSRTQRKLSRVLWRCLKFPEGPPLLDVPVAHLKARYLFLPYGSLLEVGEKVRIWMENGQTETVFIGDKWPVDFSVYPPRIVAESAPSWAQVALDSGLEETALLHWAHNNPLYNPAAPACVMRFEHIAVPRPTLWERWQCFLYRVRNL